jgi:hypothetical protein
MASEEALAPLELSPKEHHNAALAADVIPRNITPTPAPIKREGEKALRLL